MKSKNLIRDYYDNDPEKEDRRLSHPYRALEWGVTMHLINRYFPGHGTVADIGGATGRYSLALAEKGFDVTLIDISEKCLALAKEKLRGHSCVTLHMDAMDLSALGDQTFDAVLLLGPLYHLMKRKERISALNEAYRVLKPGGVAIIAYHNAWGTIRFGITNWPDKFEDKDFINSLLGHTSCKDTLEMWTDCYFATPKSAKEEIEESGFQIHTYACCHGLASGQKKVMQSLSTSNQKAYQNIYETVINTCEHPAWRDSSEQLRYVVNKPV